MSENGNIEYYGMIQANHGHDYLFVFTLDELRAFAGNRFEEIQGFLPASEKEDGEMYDICFPIGGSNSSATAFYYLRNEDEAVAFLKRDCFGPDVEDPMLVDLAEYMHDIDLDWGCGKALCEKHGIDPQKYHQEDDRKDEVCALLGISVNDM